MLFRSFDVPKHSVSAIIGPNGAGKTTLFNLITGHLRPEAGAVVLEGRDITGLPPHDVCRLGMGRSFQRTNIFPPATRLPVRTGAFNGFACSHAKIGGVERSLGPIHG